MVEKKKSTKKKPVNVKTAALDFLQTKSLDLRAKTPQILDIQFAEKPARLVLTVDSKIKTPKLTHNGVEFEVEVVVKSASDAPKVASDKAKEILAKYPGAVNPDSFYHHTAEQAISPMQDGSKSDSAAYKAWKERNKGVKTS